MADMAQAHDSLVKKKDQEHADDLAQHQQQTQEHIKGEYRRAPIHRWIARQLRDFDTSVYAVVVLNSGFWLW